MGKERNSHAVLRVCLLSVILHFASPAVICLRNDHVEFVNSHMLIQNFVHVFSEFLRKRKRPSDSGENSDPPAKSLRL